MGLLMPFSIKANFILVVVHFNVTHSACCFLTFCLGTGQDGRDGILSLVEEANDQFDHEIMTFNISLVPLCEKEAG